MIKIIQVHSPKSLKKKIPENSYLVSINENPIHDYLDFQYHQISSRLKMDFLDSKKENPFTISWHENEELYFDFEDLKIKSCPNKCLFCFIDQLPKGLRKELYIKDEDFRLSFSHGNFITGTSLSEQDINKIIKMNLSKQI